MAGRVFYTKVGSQKAITAILGDLNGPTDLTGGTVELQVGHSDTDQILINSAATIVDGPAGSVYYSPTQVEADALPVGQHPMQWKVTGLIPSPIYFPDDGQDVLVVETNMGV